jgi:hypothetical protein
MLFWRSHVPCLAVPWTPQQQHRGPVRRYVVIDLAWDLGVDVLVRGLVLDMADMLEAECSHVAI